MKWSYVIPKKAPPTAPWLGIFHVGHRASEACPPLIGHPMCCHGGQRGVAHRGGDTRDNRGTFSPYLTGHWKHKLYCRQESEEEGRTLDACSIGSLFLRKSIPVFTLHRLEWAPGCTDCVAAHFSRILGYHWRSIFHDLKLLCLLFLIHHMLRLILWYQNVQCCGLVAVIRILSLLWDTSRMLRIDQSIRFCCCYYVAQIYSYSSRWLVSALLLFTHAPTHRTRVIRNPNLCDLCTPLAQSERK